MQKHIWELTVFGRKPHLMGKQKTINHFTINYRSRIYLSFTLQKKNQLEDFHIYGSNIPIFCNNTTAIFLSKNPILDSRAKYIEIKHHFIRDYVPKGTIVLKFIDTDH